MKKKIVVNKELVYRRDEVRVRLYEPGPVCGAERPICTIVVPNRAWADFCLGWESKLEKIRSIIAEVR